MAIVDEMRKQKHADREFAAALKGIKLGGEEVDKVEQLKMKVAAERAGMSQDDFELSLAGIGIESDDD